MPIKRFWAMFTARNKEFFRDRAAFGWNFLFPFLLVAGFGIIFGGKAYTSYKVGFFPPAIEPVQVEDADLPKGFRENPYIKFIPFRDAETGLAKLRQHKIDFLIRIGKPPHRYWVSSDSPKGFVIEQMFKASLAPGHIQQRIEKQAIESRPFRYIDWLFPGILAMNMMFSALWGVGYVVVRYRKNGVLKRLKATPLTAFEYLAAQMTSRIFLLMFTLAVVWFGCDMIFSFSVAGSYTHLFLMFLIGSLSLTALGLLLAARGTSEEFATGILNFITWPMMFLSEVWFSIEGAPQWVRTAANIFPLTHLLTAVRRIMQDGAGLVDVAPQILVLIAMTLCFLVAGALLFSWNQ
jgi:ABC-type multidrug transport system permease subunit